MAPKGWREFNEAALAQAVAIALKTVETAARLRNGWAKLPFPGGIGKWPDLCRKAQDASGRVKGGTRANPEKQAPGYGTKGVQASKRIRWDPTVAALILIAIPIWRDERARKRNGGYHAA